MDAARDQRDRIVSTGERPVMQENAVEQPLLPEDERIVSANPSADAAVVGPSRDAGIADPGGYFSVFHMPNDNSSYEWDASRAGYAHSIGGWDGYPQYVSPEGYHVPPVIYNENPSLLFHSGFGFNPMPSLMIEGQVYSPHQIPFSPTYYTQPAPFDASSAIPISPSELVASKGSGDNVVLGPGSGYVVPQTLGILGPYEQNAGQIPLHGYGIASSSSFGGYPHAGSYQSPYFANPSVPYLGGDDRVRATLEKGRRRDRDQDSVSTSSDLHGNRGPRASKVKGKNNSELSSSGNEKNNSASSGPTTGLYNRPDFVTDYKNARFFIIKSFSEDNVHRSIKYNVWASTPHGNKKLDAAYQEAKAMDGDCPVFLFFSVNASGQFCGVAEMVGPVDFEKNAEYWQQDRWSGQFPVKWHIIKDVPNNRFRHILLQNNDNKPVTHSRDSQEVKLEQGIEMLKIFKDYEARASILDDFVYYDEREKVLQERKAIEQASSTSKDTRPSHADDSLNRISEHLSQTLTLEDGTKQKQPSATNPNLGTELINDTSRSFSPSTESEEKGVEPSSSADTGGGKQN